MISPLLWLFGRHWLKMASRSAGFPRSLPVTHEVIMAKRFSWLPRYIDNLLALHAVISYPQSITFFCRRSEMKKVKPLCSRGTVHKPRKMGVIPRLFRRIWWFWSTKWASVRRFPAKSWLKQRRHERKESSYFGWLLLPIIWTMRQTYSQDWHITEHGTMNCKKEITSNHFKKYKYASFKIMRCLVGKQME